MTQEDSDARFWFIEGECDAIGMEKAKHPDNYYYMMGYNDAKYELSLGRICWRWNEQNEFVPVETELEF